MLALCARYQLRPVGLALNVSHRRTACDDGSPASPPSSATVSQPSRSSRSLTARHHTLPGGDASSGLSTPRRACQRMNDNAARRNGRCRGARPVGPWNTPRDQRETRRGIVARGGDLRLGPRQRADRVAHRYAFGSTTPVRSRRCSEASAASLISSSVYVRLITGSGSTRPCSIIRAKSGMSRLIHVLPLWQLRTVRPRSASITAGNVIVDAIVSTPV